MFLFNKANPYQLREVTNRYSINDPWHQEAKMQLAALNETNSEEPEGVPTEQLQGAGVPDKLTQILEMNNGQLPAELETYRGEIPDEVLDLYLTGQKDMDLGQKQAPEPEPELSLEDFWDHSEQPTLNSVEIDEDLGLHTPYEGGEPFDPLDTTVKYKGEPLTIEDERITIINKDKELIARPEQDYPGGSLVEGAAGVGGSIIAGTLETSADIAGFMGSEEGAESIQGVADTFAGMSDYYFHNEWIPNAAAYVMQKTGEDNFTFDLAGNERLSFETKALIGIADNADEAREAILKQFPDAEFMVVGGDESMLGKDYIFRPDKDSPWSYTMDRLDIEDLVARGLYEGVASVGGGLQSLGAVKLAAKTPGGPAVKAAAIGAAFITSLAFEGATTAEVRNLLQDEFDIQLSSEEEQELQVWMESLATAGLGGALAGGGKLGKQVMPNFIREKFMDRQPSGLKLIESINKWAVSNGLEPIRAFQISNAPIMRRLTAQWAQLSAKIPDLRRKQITGALDVMARYANRTDILDEAAAAKQGEVFSPDSLSSYKFHADSVADMRTLQRAMKSYKDGLVMSLNALGPAASREEAGAALNAMIGEIDEVMLATARAHYGKLDEMIPPGLVEFDTTPMAEAMGPLRGWSLSSNAEDVLSSANLDPDLQQLFRMGETLEFLGGSRDRLSKAQMSRAAKNYKAEFEALNLDINDPRDVLLYYKKRLGDIAFGEKAKRGDMTNESITIARNMYNAVDEVLLNPTNFKDRPELAQQWKDYTKEANKVWKSFKEIHDEVAYDEIRAASSGSLSRGAVAGKDTSSIIGTWVRMDDPASRDLKAVASLSETLDSYISRAASMGIPVDKMEGGEKAWKKVQGTARADILNMLQSQSQDEARLTIEKLDAFQRNYPELTEMLYGPEGMYLEEATHLARVLRRINETGVEMPLEINPTLIDNMNRIVSGDGASTKSAAQALQLAIKQDPDLQPALAQAVRQALASKNGTLGVITRGKNVKQENLTPSDLNIDPKRLTEALNKLQDSGVLSLLPEEEVQGLKMMEAYNIMVRGQSDTGAALVGAAEISQLQKLNMSALWTLFLSGQLSGFVMSKPADEFLKKVGQKWSVSEHARFLATLSNALSGDLGADKLDETFGGEPVDLDVFPEVE